MNKAYKLFDEGYILALFRRKLRPFYPQFASIDSVAIIPHKKHIWVSTYHVVAEYEVRCREHNGNITVLPIFCSAHDSEPRRNVYDALHYLWEHGFEGEEFSIPHPLFFSEYLNSVFYRGVIGHNLRYYIHEVNQEEINRIVPQTARWFARLHALPTENTRNFNEINSRIRTVIPGVDKIMSQIFTDYPEYADFYQKAYKHFIEQEESFLASTPRRWLIHGDAHPENIIKMSDSKLGVIDFSDLSLSDFARDLGCFTQQLRYMMGKAGWEKESVLAAQKIFLDEYARVSGCRYDPVLLARIDNYHDWTSVRTITYLLLSGVIERDAERMARIEMLISQLQKKLNL